MLAVFLWDEKKIKILILWVRIERKKDTSIHQTICEIIKSYHVQKDLFKVLFDSVNIFPWNDLYFPEILLSECAYISSSACFKTCQAFSARKIYTPYFFDRFLLWATTARLLPCSSPSILQILDLFMLKFTSRENLTKRYGWLLIWEVHVAVFKTGTWCFVMNSK